MIKRKIKFSVPEYREKKEIYEIFGYKEVGYKEKGYKAIVTFELDDTREHYKELKKLERTIYAKGPIFLPIILFVIGAFILLSCFVIEIGKSARYGYQFDLINNALGFLLPAFFLLFCDVVYTYFYFKINRKLMERRKPTIEEIKQRVEEIRNS